MTETGYVSDLSCAECEGPIPPDFCCSDTCSALWYRREQSDYCCDEYQDDIR